MPVAIRFEDENRLVIWEFSGNWTWNEYYEQRNAVNATIEASPHIVNMIIDLTNSNILPTNVLSNARSATRTIPTNLGKTIFVGTNALLRSFFNMFKQVSGAVSRKAGNYHMVATLDEAYALLKKQDQAG